MSQTHITKVFKQFVDEIGFRFYPTGPASYLGIYSGRTGKWPVFCKIRDSLLTFSSVLPVTVPVEKRPAVMQYINRANWKLAVGNLELDLDDGEVRYRTSIDVADGTLTPLWSRRSCFAT